VRAGSLLACRVDCCSSFVVPSNLSLVTMQTPRPDAATDLLVVGNPVKLSRVAEGPVARFPRLGEHTDAVLRSTLGLDAAQLEELRARGVIG